MRLLANENFPRDEVDALRENGHDIAWIREDARGSMDEQVLARAQEEKLILITLDKDFGEFAFHAKLPATLGIILFRIFQDPLNTLPKWLYRRLKDEAIGKDISLS